MFVSPPRRRRRAAASAAVLAFVAAVLGLPAPAEAHPAKAHPFGDPQTVAIASDPERPEVVHIRWKVGGLDDLTLLGVELGLLPRDRVMLDGAVSVRASDAAAIGPSDEFAAYLLEQITVASGGRKCAGTVQPPRDLARAGVTIDYTCPGPVGTATVDVRTLTDLDPAYRIFVTGPDGQLVVYGSGEYSHDWVLGDAPADRAEHADRADLARSAAVQIIAVLGGVLLVAVAALVVLRRLRRASP